MADMTEEEQDNMINLLDSELHRVGYTSFPVTDGQMFIFNTATIERLLKEAKKNPDGRAAVLVKRAKVA